MRELTGPVQPGIGACHAQHQVYHQGSYPVLICTEDEGHEDKHYDSLFHMEWDEQPGS